MKDLKLDFINKKMLNEIVNKKERIVQQIIVAVRSWIGDFFLNENFGIDYDNSWGNTLLLELYIREQVEAIDGVFVVNSIDVKKRKTIKIKIMHKLL